MHGTPLHVSLLLDYNKMRKLNDEEVKRLYLKEGLSGQQIGAIFGATRQAVYQSLRRTKTARRPAENPLCQHIDDVEVDRLYSEIGLSEREVAKRLGVDKNVIRSSLRRSHAIKRSPGRHRKIVNPLVGIPETDITWLAGILEGEGCFYLKRYKRNPQRPTPMITLKMTDEDVVLRASIMMGSSIQRCAPQLGRKQLFVSSLSGGRACGVMQQLLPYMGRRRADRIRELLAFYAQ